MLFVQTSWELRLNKIEMRPGQSISSVAPKILWEQDSSINKTEVASRFLEILFFHQIYPLININNSKLLMSY